MVETSLSVLVVGSTGSVGRLVVEEAVRRGHDVRALVRDASRVDSLASGAKAVVGDLTDSETLGEALDVVDAVIFTHGSHGGAEEAERIDYGAVRNVFQALGDRRPRIALMTAIGVTRPTPGHDWKRRGERLVRASGSAYTIVRPGWFDYNKPDELSLTMLQGDRRWAGDPSDGVISRRQIAQVLVASLTSEAASHKTLELVSEHGAAQDDLDPLFAALEPDRVGDVDAVEDRDTLPAADEPTAVLENLRLVGQGQPE
jgi:uncharacterized protein YbjT (DUF2867 family)